MLNTAVDTPPKTACAHCGEACPNDEHQLAQKTFCCNGCKMVYQLLSDHGLEAYYQYEVNPGTNQKVKSDQAYDYLDNQDLISKLLLFQEGGIAKMKFTLPQIHCSSCLYLLENISKLDPGIISSKVNFLAKEVVITYREADTTLRSVVELLSKIGYAPRLHLDQIDPENKVSKYDKKLLYKLGLAGFAFGNIMLLSFPEYLGFDKASYLFHIGYINILLATPVLLYSGVEYLKSAWRGITISNLNIDIPIALGMITLYARSVYEIVSHNGEGYLDSFAGFVFFLLIGRWFQSFTNQILDFDRNYKSYFPISALVKLDGNWISKSLDQIMPGDTLRIKNQELIPADATLTKGKARIDYSFVTGESDHLVKTVGETLYAGGRHQGESIEILLSASVNQSYLTQLWNDDTFKNRPSSNTTQMVSWISKYFTIAVLLIATASMTYWYITDKSIAFQTFTAVLIVACPCALALAIPFTYGNILRLLTRHGLYLRNVSTIEDIQDINYIIFDKTGTITDSHQIKINYQGKALDDHQLSFIRSACSHSSHPLSKAIVGYYPSTTVIDIDQYEDFIGLGFTAKCDGHSLRLGSSTFIFGTADKKQEKGVFVEIDGQYVGYYKFEDAIRENAQMLIDDLKSNYKLALLSGDNDNEESRMKQLFGEDSLLHFQQSPHDKLAKIKALQDQGHKVMMIGDGLNDAGALKQSNVGFVLSDEVNNFSPACDGILEGKRFPLLIHQMQFLNKAKYIIYGAFAMALLYNTIGLYFAVTGQMSPVIAAILMPLSSISVIIYGVVSSYIMYSYYLSRSIQKGSKTNTKI